MRKIKKLLCGMLALMLVFSNLTPLGVKANELEAPTEEWLEENGWYINNDVYEKNVDGVNYRLSYSKNTYQQLINADYMWQVLLTKSPDAYGEIVIPDEIDGYPVTSILQDAFRNNYDITECVFGSNIIYVGKSAFLNCKNLTSVRMNEGLKMIDAGSFEGCQNLSSLIIPSTLEKIGRATFNGNTTRKTGLQTLTFKGNAPEILYVSENTTQYLFGLNGTMVNHFYDKTGFDTEQWTPLNLHKVEESEKNVELIELSSETVTIMEGQEETIEASIYPNVNGARIEWLSSNESVVTVEDGKLTAIGIGTATITAICGISFDTVSVTVKEYSIEPTDIIVTVEEGREEELENYEFNLVVGDTVQMYATAEPSNATFELTWDVWDDSIITVDNGLVTAVGEGYGELCIRCKDIEYYYFFNVEAAEVVVNKDELFAKIDEVLNLSKDLYTPSSWSNLQMKLSLARRVYNDLEATQEEVDMALENLQTAINGLIELADKTALIEKIAEGNALVRGNYTQETWDVLTAALSLATSTRNHEDATQEEVDYALNNLTNAIDSLELNIVAQSLSIKTLPNKTAYIQGEELDLTGLELLLTYNIGDPEVITTGYEIMGYDKDYVGTQNLTITYNGLTTTLFVTVNAKIIVADTTVLLNLLNTAEELIEKEYTEESYAVLKDAINYANTVLSNTQDLRQFEVDHAVEVLESAINGLVKKPASIFRVTVHTPPVKDQYFVGEEFDSTGLELYVEYDDDTERIVTENYEVTGFDSSVPGAIYVTITYEGFTTSLEIIIKEIPAPEVYLYDLQVAIENAEAIEEDEYTPSSFGALKEALDGAKELLNKDEKTQEEVDEATANLLALIDSLVKRANKSSLIAVIDAANLLNSDEYTKLTWAVLQEKLSEANSVNDNADATQADVDNASNALQLAIDELVKRADKTDLKLHIERTNELVEYDYTSSSWNSLQTVLSEAIEMLNSEDDVTQEEIDAVVESLINTINSLEYAANKKNLEDAIEDARSLTSEEYTEESWAALDAVVADAMILLENNDATQSEVDEKETLVRQAIDALIKVEIIIVDKMVLESTISEVEELTKENYTEESWTALETVLVNALEVFTNEDVTQEDVDSAVLSLRNAIDALVEKEPEKPTSLVTEVYTDVDADQWYTEAVQYVYDKGLMTGIGGGKFNTMGDVTRAQVAMVLYRLAGSPEVTDRSAVQKFSDVNEGEWFTDAMCWAYNNGITTSGSNKLNPYKAITREQLFTYMYRYAGIKGLLIDGANSTPDAARFMDGLDGVSSWAQEATYWIVNVGIINGNQIYKDGKHVGATLNAQGIVSRAQLSTVLMRFSELYK